MFAVGSLVAGYRIEHVLAVGATGTVYLAKNPTLPRSDALKVLSAGFSRDPAFRERFVREVGIASLLDHPSIVSICNRGEADDGQLWIAMQYVAGTDAEAALRAGTMTPARASASLVKSPRLWTTHTSATSCITI
jgi:eukaryotic-like serine/threonine-protein kinase